MSAFLDMGGFAGFVWPCYALSLGGMIWLAAASWHRTRTTAKQLADLTGDETGAGENSNS